MVLTSELFISEFCDVSVLPLSLSEKVGIGLSPADSNNADIRITGK